MTERLAPPARLALELARDEVEEAGGAAITPHHLVIGILLAPGSGAATALKDAGVTLDSLSGRRRDEYRVRTAVIAPEEPIDLEALGGKAASALERAYELADEMGHPIVDTAHLLLTVLEAPDKIVRAKVIDKGLTPHAVRVRIFGLR